MSDADRPYPFPPGASSGAPSDAAPYGASSGASYGAEQPYGAPPPPAYGAPPYATPPPLYREPPGTFLESIRGPLMLIALGVLFALDYQMGLRFSRTWPILLVLYGVLKLMEHVRGRDDEGYPRESGNEGETRGSHA